MIAEEGSTQLRRGVLMRLHEKCVPKYSMQRHVAATKKKGYLIDRIHNILAILMPFAYLLPTHTEQKCNSQHHVIAHQVKYILCIS